MEVTVGAFMFMILLALGFFTIVLSTENIFTHSYRRDVIFSDVKGLREGDNVFVRGVSVGKIRRLQIKPDGVHVSVSLQQPPKLHADYKIEVLPSSVLGGRYLNIAQGSESQPFIPENEIVRGLPPVDLIDEATRTIQDIKKAMEEGAVLENLKVTMQQIREITTKLNHGEGTLGKLLEEDAVYSDLRKITANLSDISTRLAQGKGTIGKLLSENDHLYDDLAAAAASLKDVAGTISRGEGTLGKLTKNDELYQETRLLLHEIRATVDDFRETTPVTTFASIFFGAF